MNYKTMVSIDGKRLSSFDRIVLEQSINKHHRFDLIVDHDEIERWGSHTLEASKNWLGSSIVISFGETDFVGVITKVKLCNKDGHEGDLIVSGFSKTILLEQGKHTRSWEQKSLRQIVKDTVSAAQIETEITSGKNEIRPYEAQYNETHFQFLQRLAKQHNQWLMYDGLRLVFGKPSQAYNPIHLEYGRELNRLHIGIKVKANKQHVFSYNAESDEVNESKSKNRVAGLNELGMHAFDTSLGLYKDPVTSHSVVRVKDRSTLDESLSLKQAATAANLNVLEADCSVQGLKLGSIIKIKSARNLGKEGFELNHYGEYQIIAIKHKAGSCNTYSCHFKAIPGGVTVLPEPKVDLPLAYPQLGKVISNADPKGMGRVKVQFGWQQYHETTHWIRVLMPDAGSGTHHTQNRGHVFIPEEGDQVMVGFRHHDPNRPFVMGSVYHGKNGKGGGPDNTVKTISTRSGHVIRFDDTNKKESITVTDRKGNVVFIDTANDNISVTAHETIKLKAKNIVMEAEETISSVAGDKINITAENLLSELVKQGNKEVTVKGHLKTNVEKDILQHSENSSIKVNSTSEEESQDKKIIAKSVLNLSGKSGAVLESSTTEIKGSANTLRLP